MRFARTRKVHATIIQPKKNEGFYCKGITHLASDSDFRFATTQIQLLVDVRVRIARKSKAAKSLMRRKSTRVVQHSRHKLNIFGLVGTLSPLLCKSVQHQMYTQSLKPKTKTAVISHFTHYFQKVTT